MLNVRKFLQPVRNRLCHRLQTSGDWKYKAWLWWWWWWWWLKHADRSKECKCAVTFLVAWCMFFFFVLRDCVSDGVFLTQAWSCVGVSCVCVCAYDLLSMPECTKDMISTAFLQRSHTLHLVQHGWLHTLHLVQHGWLHTLHFGQHGWLHTLHFVQHGWLHTLHARRVPTNAIPYENIYMYIYNSTC